MKKTLAVLATVAAVGVTAVAAPAPAEARGRGIGPGLAFGLAAGAITAGAVAASQPYGYGYGPRYGYYGGPGYYRPGPYAYYGGGPYYRHHHHWRQWEPFSNEKPGAMLRAFFMRIDREACYGQSEGRSTLRAFSSVDTKYSSRSRLNFSCVARKAATRAAISSRSRALRSSSSVIAIPSSLLLNPSTAAASP